MNSTAFVIIAIWAICAIVAIVNKHDEEWPIIPAFLTVIIGLGYLALHGK